jgi:hypothetical protein
VQARTKTTGAVDANAVLADAVIAPATDAFVTVTVAIRVASGAIVADAIVAESAGFTAAVVADVRRASPARPLAGGRLLDRMVAAAALDAK